MTKNSKALSLLLVIALLFTLTLPLAAIAAEESGNVSDGSEATSESSRPETEESNPDNSEPAAEGAVLTVKKPDFGDIKVSGNIISEEYKNGMYSFTVVKDSVVTVTVFPENGSQFDVAYIDGVQAEFSAGSFDVLMDTDRTVRVVFKNSGYVTVWPSISFSDSYSGDDYALYLNGSKAEGNELKLVNGVKHTFSLSLPTGYMAETATFYFESGDAPIAVQFDGDSCTVPALSGNATVVISILRTEGVILKTKVNGNGSVTVSDKAPEIGKAVTFTVMPESGYIVQSATLNGIKVQLSGNKFTILAFDNMLFEVTFIPRPGKQQVSLSVNPESGYGKIAFESYEGDTAMVEYSALVSLVFFPDDGYEVDRVYVNGIATTGANISNNKMNLHVTQDTEVVVSFSRAKHKITAVVVDDYGGTITSDSYDIVNGMATVQHGGSITFRFNPDMGHFVSYVKVNGKQIENDGSGTYTFENVTTANTITVAFLAKGEETTTYKISVNCGPNGSVTPSGSPDVEEGGDIVFTFIPLDGYEVENVLLDGAPAILTKGSLVLTSVNSSHTVSVTFRLTTGSVPNSITIESVDWDAEVIVLDTSVNYKIKRSVFEKINNEYSTKAVIIKNSIYTVTVPAGTVFEPKTEYTNMSYGTDIPSGSELAFLNEVESAGIGGAYTLLILPSILPEKCLLNISLGDRFAAKTVVIYSFSGEKLVKTVSGLNVSPKGELQAEVSPASPIVFAVDITAPQNYVVNVYPGMNGTVSPSEAQTVEEGGTLVLTLIPFDGYMVSGIMVNGEEIERSIDAAVNGKCNFTLKDIKSNLAVEVTFSVMPLDTGVSVQLVLTIIIISVALVGGGALLFVKWKQMRY